MGNLEASRDWGFAGDYVEGMWMMLQHKIVDDWVLATGETLQLKICGISIEQVNLEPSSFVEISKKYFRPNEVNYLLEDPTKAKNELNWEPKTSFKELVSMMVKSDPILAEQEKLLLEQGLLHPSWENYKNLLVRIIF